MSVFDVTAVDRLKSLGRLVIFATVYLLICLAIIACAVGLAWSLHAMVAVMAGHPVGAVWHYALFTVSAAVGWCATRS